MDGNVVAKEDGGMIFAQRCANPSEAEYASVEALFLCEFPQRCFLRAFAFLNVTFGQSPTALVTALPLLYEENSTVCNNPCCNSEVT